MATQTQTAPSPPEFKIINRVCSIPLISSSLDTINETLSSNAYTRSPYSTARGISTSAYKYSTPLQIRLAPILVVADTYANKAVDVVENTYPYPFKAKPEEVVEYVRDRRDSASLYVSKRRQSVNVTIDENVVKPAYNVAHGLDQQLTPFVDYFETAVTKLNGSSESSPISPNGAQQYQYQRALALSKDLKNSLYSLSNEQLKQLQESSVLVQRATETAQAITSLASSSVHTAQHRIYALSDAMLTDLRRIQTSLSGDLRGASESLAHVIGDLSDTLRSDLPVREKVSRVGADVRDRVSPVLDNVAAKVKEVISLLAMRGEDAVESAKEATKTNNGDVNGHAE